MEKEYAEEVRSAIDYDNEHVMEAGNTSVGSAIDTEPDAPARTQTDGAEEENSRRTMTTVKTRKQARIATRTRTRVSLRWFRLRSENARSPALRLAFNNRAHRSR